MTTHRQTFVVSAVWSVLCATLAPSCGTAIQRVGERDSLTSTTVATFHPLMVREDSLNSTDQEVPRDDGGGEQSFLEGLRSYWFVVLVIAIVVLVAGVFVCACLLQRKRRSGHRVFHFELKHHTTSSPGSSRSRGQSNSGPPHTDSSIVDLASMSPGSLSVDPTPIPSPLPSFTSQQSLRSNGGWRGGGARGSGRGPGGGAGTRKKRRNHSPGNSSRSGSEETIRAADMYGHSTTSLTSSGSSRGHAPQTQSLTGAERASPSQGGHAGHRRSTSNPVVKVNISGVGVDGDATIRSAHSTTSMLSVGSNQSSRSNRSGHSSRTQSDASSQQTVVQVDVQVHLSPDQERDARTAMAVALAESARQLAQSAADFGKEEDMESPSHYPYHRRRVSGTLPMSHQPERRHLFPSHSSSYLPAPYRDYGTSSRPYSPQALQTVSLDRPTNVASLDQPTRTFSLPRERYQRSSHKASPPSPLTVYQDSSLRRSLNSPAGSSGAHLPRPPLRQFSYLDNGQIELSDDAGGGTVLRQPDSIYLHRPHPYMRPFHTLESYPLRPKLGSESHFLSLRSERSRAMNGSHSTANSTGGARLGRSTTRNGPRMEEARLYETQSARVKLHEGAEEEGVSREDGDKGKDGGGAEDGTAHVDPHSLTLPHHQHSTCSDREPSPHLPGSLPQPSSSASSTDVPPHDSQGTLPRKAGLSAGSHAPHTSPTYSTSSHSVDDETLTRKKQLPASPSLERQSSEPNISHRSSPEGVSEDQEDDDEGSNHRHSKTCSLPRSNSALSMEGPPLSSTSTASGYAPTGSGSSLDTKSPGTPHLPDQDPSQAEEREPELDSQYSYPLQRLLTQACDPHLGILAPPPNSSTSPPLPPTINDIHSDRGRLHLHSHTHHRRPRNGFLGSGYAQGRWVVTGGEGIYPAHHLGREPAGMARRGNQPPSAVSLLPSQPEFYPDHNHVTIEV